MYRLAFVGSEDDIEMPEALETHYLMEDSGLPYAMGGLSDQPYIHILELNTVKNAINEFWQIIKQNAKRKLEQAAQDASKSQSP